MLGRVLPYLTYMQGRLTKWVAARELRLLCVFCGELVADAVEQLHIALLGIFPQSRHKRPGHGPSSLRSNGGIGTAGEEC
jgi:hypothetical protein